MRNWIRRCRIIPYFSPRSVPQSQILSGEKFFESKGIERQFHNRRVGRSGCVSCAGQLRKMQTPEDKIRSAEDAQAYVLRYGLTTSVDMGVFADPDSPDLQDSFTFPGIASANPWTVYDQILALDHQQKLDERVRLFIISMDKTMALPLLTERLLQRFPRLWRRYAAGIGDRRICVALVCEFRRRAASGKLRNGVADGRQARLDLSTTHVVSAEVQFTAQTYEKVNAVTPIADLHWSIAHVPAIDPQTLAVYESDRRGNGAPRLEISSGRPGHACGTTGRSALSHASSRAGYTPARARTLVTFPCSIPGTKSITWSPAKIAPAH